MRKENTELLETTNERLIESHCMESMPNAMMGRDRRGGGVTRYVLSSTQLICQLR